MTWHAIDSLGDAIDATRRLLLPFSVRRWLTLAVVVFFVSGITGSNSSFNVGGLDVEISAPPPAPFPEPIRDEYVVEIAETTAASPRLLFFLLAAGAVILVGLVFLYVASVMEFVFVDIARSEDVRIRGFFGDSTGKGLSLFGFRIGIGVLLLSILVLFGLLTFLTGGLFLLFVVVLSPVLILAAIGLWLLLRFTADFVVPVMIAEDVGVIEGWRTFWPALKTDWKQYGVYAVVRFLLGIAVGVAAGIGFVAIAIALLVPFGIVGLGGYLLLGTVAPAAAVPFSVGVVVLFVLALLIAVVTLVLVPLETYLRYYALFVLGAVTPEFDLVADIRQAIEAEKGDRDGGGEGVSPG